VEIVAAVIAVAHARPGPPVAEDAVNAVARDDFPGHIGHELEVVGTERACDPQLRHDQVAALLAGGIHRDPVGVGVVDILVRRVRIGTRHHHHSQFPAARREFPECVAIAQPLAAIMQRDGSGIVGHASAGAQTSGVGMGTLEIIQPESGIVLAGIVFDQGQLGPTHGAIKPAVRFSRGGA
jgi:hypothetical protein